MILFDYRSCMVKVEKTRLINSYQDFSHLKKKQRFQIFYIIAALLLENNLVEKKCNTTGIDSENPLRQFDIYHWHVAFYMVC